MTNSSRLHELLKKGSWEKARKQLQEAGVLELIHETDDRGRIPLHIAIWKGGPESLVLSLIDVDEETVQAKTDYNETPLHYATCCGASYKVIERLIRKYPRALDERTKGGKTPRDYTLRKLNSKSRKLIEMPTAEILEEQWKNAEAERSSLRRQVAERETKIDELRHKSETKIAEHKKTEQAMSQKIKDLEDAVMSKDGKLAELTEASERETFRYDQCERALSVRIRELEKKLADAESECDSVKKQLAQRVSELANLRSTTDEEKRRHKESERAMAQKTKELEKKVDRLGKLSGANVAKLKGYEQSEKSLALKVSSLEKKLEAAQVERNLLRERCSELEDSHSGSIELTYSGV